jgi:hypothetical protein
MVDVTAVLLARWYTLIKVLGLIIIFAKESGLDCFCGLAS